MMMNPVQQKISCVYKTGVVDEASTKRQHQTFRVSAMRELNCRVLKSQISSARATEKIDGTCCLVAEFQDQPWLWARHDRKPSKVGERRFAQYKKSKATLKQTDMDENNIKPFEWDPMKDFKDVPEHWMPALRLEIKDGVAMPDDIGHTPGWVPVQKHQRQHCWHTEAVDVESGTALVLREVEQSTASLNDLVIQSVSLSDLMNQTCELIGTNINGNPYGLGSKKNPFHILVPHGTISLNCPNPCDFDAMWNWMALNSAADGEGTVLHNQVEGIVWHCGNGQLYKLHRHHLNLKWPDGEPSLCQRRVHVKVADLIQNETEQDKDGDTVPEKNKSTGNMLKRISCLNGQSFNSFKSLNDSLVDAL